MTDDDLTPEQQEVRRLLADARHAEPMPDAVVARLDRVLADLADEPVRVAPVTALATRRRRATSLLLAAAAVVAIGVGVGQVVGTGQSDGGDSLSASTRDEGGADDRDTQAEVATPDGPKDGDGGGAEAPNESTSSEQSGADAFAKLERSTLAADVTALREQSYSADMIDGLAAAFDATARTCRSDAWGEGQFVPVRYDGIPAVLVFRRAMGDSQVADLFLCGDAEPRRSVTLPAP